MLLTILNLRFVLANRNKVCVTDLITEDIEVFREPMSKCLGGVAHGMGGLAG